MTRRICGRCVLPESLPDIRLDDEGVCNICLEHEASKGAEPVAPALETDFVKILEQNRGKGEYDCLAMCSGGKDSTAALYYMVRRYKARVLAFTFDHGFETPEAMENVRRAVEALGVDFLFFRTEFMTGLFSKLLETGSRAVICHLCSIWYMDLTFRMAGRFSVPLIIAGWTKGQSSHQGVMSKCGCNANQPEFAAMARETRAFIDAHVRRDPRYRDFPDGMEEVLARAKKRHRCLVLSPHWFLPHDSEVYVPLIQKELGWSYPRSSYPAKTTNCALNFLAVRNSLRDYGYTHYHVEMSKLIREGQMTREEALSQLDVPLDAGILEAVERRLGGGGR